MSARRPICSAMSLLCLLLLSACPDKDTGDDSGPGCDGTIVINEFVANPGETDTGKEWIELYNPGTESVDISGWYFRSFTSPTRHPETAALPAGTVIAPGGFLLVGGDAVAGTDVTMETDLGSGAGGDGVYLINACDTVIDAVVFGDSNDDEAPDETGAPSPTFAPKPDEDEPLVRCPNGGDTNASGDDFRLLAVGEETPGALNSTCPATECSKADEVTIVINEFVANLTSTDTNKEWVEIYNAGDTLADLSGWVLASATKPTSPTPFTLPTGTTLEPGAVLVVAGPDAGVPTDVIAALDLGNGSKGDGLYLLDCGGTLVDAVVYGDSNEDGMPDEFGAPATSIAELPGDGEALARCPDGTDTNASGDDFRLLAAGDETPGELNGDCGGGDTDTSEPTDECVPADESTVVINEFVANPDSDDTDKEWAEIYNAGAAEEDLSGWVVEWYKSNPTTPSGHTVLPAGTTLAAGHFLVIADSLAGVPTDVTASLDIGNGSDGDGLYLRDSLGNLIDAVVYGGSYGDGILDESCLPATSVAPNPGEDDALGRIPDGTDTNASGDDFCVLSTPSAGSANGACE